MSSNTLLRVAVLVDLPRTPLSGGHVRGWERLARAAAGSDLPLDLTVYFSGEEKTEKLSPHVRLRHLPPVFSTARLKFLPYVPDNTDLAPYHFKLARELAHYDVIHTTDGFFAFARTAEKIADKLGIPLTTSFHTDTPGYANVFTRRTIETLFGKGRFGHFLTDTLALPQKQQDKMMRRLRCHLSHCRAAIATRAGDIDLSKDIIGPEHVTFMRTPVDRERIGPHRADRKGMEQAYKIPEGRIIVLFIGRLDEGKNIYTLISAMEQGLAEGLPLHLITAGVGPADKDLRERLGANVTVAGFIQPPELGHLLASVDIYAHPSEVEIRSLTAAEGMVSGKPVLLSAKGGVARHYQGAGGVIEVGPAPSDWTAILRKLATDADLRQTMGAQNMRYAATNIPSDLDLMAQDFLPAWQKAANLHGG